MIGCLSPLRHIEAKPKSSNLGRKVAYSAAAAATVVAGDAEAVLVYSGVLDAPISQYDKRVFNFNGDSFDDLKLENYVFGTAPYQGAFAYSGSILGFKADRYYATALPAGAVIDSTTLAGSPFDTSLAFGAINPNAQFNNATNAYIGFSFLQFPQTYYGWVRVSIDNAAGAFVVHDWAYTDSPDGILAGQTAAIPEVATLGFFAAGSLGLAALRRRRAQSSDSEG